MWMSWACWHCITCTVYVDVLSMLTVDHMHYLCGLPEYVDTVLHAWSMWMSWARWHCITCTVYADVLSTLTPAHRGAISFICKASFFMQLGWPWKTKHPCQAVNSIKAGSVPSLSINLVCLAQNPAAHGHLIKICWLGGMLLRKDVSMKISVRSICPGDPGTMGYSFSMNVSLSAKDAMGNIYWVLTLNQALSLNTLPSPSYWFLKT